MNWFELRIPPQPAMIGVARRTAGAVGQLADLSHEAIEDARTCISEAVTNAVTAHGVLEISDPVMIRLGCDAGVLILEVHDQGGGPPTRSGPVSMPDLDVFENLPEGGFGIPVMHALADSCEIHEGETGGTVVELRFGQVPADA